MSECADFCRMAGAERIFAASEEELRDFPEAVTVLQMRGICCPDSSLIASLFPVTQQTVGIWRSHYNKAMASVDNTATMEARDEERICQSTGAYFIHDAGRLLGIGWLEDHKLLAVSAVEPGEGLRIMHTLMSLTEGEPMELEVASTNEKAIRLYEKLGFVKTAELSKWYRIS